MAPLIPPRALRRRDVGGRTRGVLGVLLAAASLAGCAVMVAGGDRAVIWECADGARLAAIPLEDWARIELRGPRGTRTLERIPAGSGAAWGDGRITFRERGGEAMLLDRDRIVHGGCRTVQ